MREGPLKKNQNEPHSAKYKETFKGRNRVCDYEQLGAYQNVRLGLKEMQYYNKVQI